LFWGFSLGNGDGDRIWGKTECSDSVDDGKANQYES
jgi:hypothetical protein